MLIAVRRDLLLCWLLFDVTCYASYLPFDLTSCIYFAQPCWFRNRTCCLSYALRTVPYASSNTHYSRRNSSVVCDFCWNASSSTCQRKRPREVMSRAERPALWCYSLTTPTISIALTSIFISRWKWGGVPLCCNSEFNLPLNRIPKQAGSSFCRDLRWTPLDGYQRNTVQSVGRA
jgi:hypothetical protein